MNLIHILVLLLIMSACVSIPGTDKKAFIIIPHAEENKMGYQAFAEIKRKEKISRNPRLNKILQRVGQRIAAQVPVHYDWEFVLIESETPNAFALPGGKVAFYTGMLQYLQNEAAMAMVMGHEVAHVVARHGGQRMSQALATQLGLVAIDATVLNDNKNRGPILAALGLGAQVGVMLPFSRSHESEADDMGLIYAAKAGYDPREAPRFWQRFSKAGGGKPPKWLSTHPPSQDRIRNLNARMPDALRHYNSSPKIGLGEKL